ncbi:MAG: DJ-1/PfpI family protein [Defluviitaleaceae bacterium]|nr:DJ-1/PfpI family protein [Defluviitaleaceae bacterium]
MYEAIVFLTTGFEEIEAVSTIDILRRGGVNVASVSLTGERQVTGSRQITVTADLLFDEVDFGNEMLILPGGPGTGNYKEHNELLELLKKHNANGGKIAAICAAPTVLGMLGLLADKTAVCYPTLEAELRSARVGGSATVTDGNITTSKCPASSFGFALEILRILKGAEEAARVGQGMGV